MPTLLCASDAIAFPVDDLYGKVDVPLVLLEAMSLGVPLVVAGDGPLATLAPAARLVPPGDDDALAAALCDLLGDEAAVRSARAIGESMYHSRFTPAVVARAYDALYAEARP